MSRFREKLGQQLNTEFAGYLKVPAKEFFSGSNKGEESFTPDTVRFLQRDWGNYEWDPEEEHVVHVRVFEGQQKAMMQEISKLPHEFEAHSQPKS